MSLKSENKGRIIITFCPLQKDTEEIWKMGQDDEKLINERNWKPAKIRSILESLPEKPIARRASRFPLPSGIVIHELAH